ncbi:MAG: hypothetical protein NVSMB12_13630 [Acidimicrobiales bacterium]
MTRAVAAHGITAHSPRGWDIRIFRRPPQPPETTHAVLHAATFAMPADVADYGDGAVQRMSPADVFVALCEFHPSSADSPLFAAGGVPGPLLPADFSRTALQHAMGGQAGVQRFFNAQSRAWCLYVVIGSFDDRVRLTGRANELVAQLEIEAPKMSGTG